MMKRKRLIEDKGFVNKNKEKEKEKKKEILKE